MAKKTSKKTTQKTSRSAEEPIRKEQMRSEMVFSIFSERDDAEKAINKLDRMGYDTKEISIIMKDKEEGKEVAKKTGANVAGGAATGAVTGGVIGGVVGLLTGIGAIAIPGIGGILIGGPIAAALGLSGAAATTASGALTGALAGGLVGALIGLGLPKEDAEEYERQIKEGGILVAVPVMGGRNSDVIDALESENASQIRTVNMTARKEHEMTDIRRETEIVNPIQVQKFLSGVDYPASKQELVEHAKDEGADRNVIATLENMPGRKFDSANDVSKAIGEMA